MTKDRLWSIGINTFVAVTVAAPFIGIGMALYTGNGNWAWLCATIILYLS